MAELRGEAEFEVTAEHEEDGVRVIDRAHLLGVSINDLAPMCLPGISAEEALRTAEAGMADFREQLRKSAGG